MRNSPGLPSKRRRLAACAALIALISGAAAPAQPRDPANPTCPPNPNWSSYPRMRFTEQVVNGQKVLLAEGAIDEDAVPRLEAALRNFEGSEIWLRSPGGDARAGNLAGRLIRANNLSTRVPAGWACHSACTFMFMGGIIRSVDPGGLLIVSMFTFTSDPAVLGQIERGGAAAGSLLADVARASVRLATEDVDYVMRMGIPRRFLTDIVYRQQAVAHPGNPSIYRCLTPEEVRSYNLVNGRQPARLIPPRRPGQVQP